MLESGLSIAALVFLLSTSSIPGDHNFLTQKNYSLLNRNKNIQINTVFADNILLTLAYMRGIVQKGHPISWDAVRAPFSYGFVLQPGETFAFHDSVSDKYRKSLKQTTNAHFIADEGFKSDGWLVGDGVCHLASFLKVAAEDAGLEVHVPSNHNFAAIADIPKADGVSIYYTPKSELTSSLHNLYITDSVSQPIAFLFEYNNSLLTISVTKIP